MNVGYISIHRKILDWEWYRNTNVFRVFMHLLITANHQDNKWQGIGIKRGQRLTSYDNIATEIGDLSVQQVRTSLNKLKSTGEITSQSTNQYTIITIINYDTYQNNNKPTNKRITNEQQTDNKRITTNNNEKNDNNDNNVNKERETHSQIRYLYELKENDNEIEDLLSKFSCTQSQLINKATDFYDYCIAKGRVYKNYKSALSNALSRDFGRRVDQTKAIKYDKVGNVIGGDE